MRGCTECPYPLTAAQDDGTGKHKGGCSPPPDREAYLANKARKMPGLVRLQDHLAEHGEATPDDLIRLRVKP